MTTAEEVEALWEATRNWGRWADDDRGTLHLVTAERRAAAAALVATGVTVSLARDLTYEPTPDNPTPASHEMLACGHDREMPGLPGYEASRDAIGTEVHGMGVTHVDALSHIFVRGQMFGGHPAELVTPEGAARGSVMPLADGVVGRGVLLDVPAARGVGWVDPSSPITPDDLSAAADRQGSTVGTGDLLIVATGRDACVAAAAAEGRTLSAFEALAGLDPACLAWIRERDVALLASDGISDRMPPVPIDGWPFPIHQVAIAGIGMPLVDNLRLDDLVAACAGHGRWEFLLSIAPLRIPGGTGCPVNPIAVF